MTLHLTKSPMILASGSATRFSILSSAGLNVLAMKSGVDEEAYKTSMRAEGISPKDQAMQLAELKALQISATETGFVIGADQILSWGDEVFDKPGGAAGVRRHLKALSGKTHTLETAICIAENGEVIWRHMARPKLTMRELSEAFIEAYIKACDIDVLRTVGGYQLEKLGGQLFTKVEGDYFSILGLPLFPLLEYLRVREKLLA